MAEPGRQAPQQRPQQVTYAASAVLLGSVALIVSAFQEIATLHSLNTRTAVAHTVARLPQGFGITTEGWLETIKVLAMVTGGCAAAAAILGWQALQRSRSARIALAVLVVPIAVAGLAIEPVFALLVAAGVVGLWLPVASAWFDPQPQESRQPMRHVPPASPTPPASSGLPALPPPTGQPVRLAAPYGGYLIDRETRPGPVTAAAVITLVLSGLSAALGLVLAIAGPSMAAELLSDLSGRGYDTRGLTAHELAVGLGVVGGLTVVVALAAIVGAVFVLRRSQAARVVLTVLSAVTILCSLIAITTVVAILTLGGAIATIVLLHQRRSSEWFAPRGPQQPSPPPPPGGSWPAS